MVPPADDYGRRRFLGLAGSALAGATASAGCLSTLPPIGQRIRYGRVDVPDGGPPEYRQWVPARSALQPFLSDPDDDALSVLFGLPGRLGGETFGRPSTIPHGIHRSLSDYVGVEYDAFDQALSFESVFVGLGDIDRAAVDRTLAGTRYESAGSQDGFALYTRSDIPRALAVGDGAIVNAVADEQQFRGANTSGVDAALGRVRTTLDAKAGRVDRQHEVDEDFALVTDRARAQKFTWIGGLRENAPDAVTGATGMTFDSATVYFLWLDVYANAAAVPSKSDLRRSLESDDRAINATMTDLQVNGRVVSIEHAMDLEQYRQRFYDEDHYIAPYTTWGVDWDPESLQLTFTYEAGSEAIESGRLVTYPEYGFEEPDPFDAHDGPFEPSDSATLQLTDDHANFYRADWHAPDGDSSTYMVNYTLPEADR